MLGNEIYECNIPSSKAEPLDTYAAYIFLYRYVLPVEEEYEIHNGNPKFRRKPSDSYQYSSSAARPTVNRALPTPMNICTPSSRIE